LFIFRPILLGEQVRESYYRTNEKTWINHFLKQQMLKNTQPKLVQVPISRQLFATALQKQMKAGGSVTKTFGEKKILPLIWYILLPPPLPQTRTINFSPLSTIDLKQPKPEIQKTDAEGRCLNDFPNRKKKQKECEFDDVVQIPWNPHDIIEKSTWRRQTCILFFFMIWEIVNVVKIFK
jgi:hypothetical protein